MVRVIRMSSPGNYNHLSDHHRNAIFGTGGHDRIVGDNETVFTYGNNAPDLGQAINPSKGDWGTWVDPEPAWLIWSGSASSFAYVKVNKETNNTFVIDEYIDGGDDWDIIDGRDGDDWLVGGKGDDFLYGGNGQDVLNGGADIDFLDTGTGYDSAYGGEGDDWFNNPDAGGGDFLDGGAGYDKLRLERHDGAFMFDLMTGVGDIFVSGFYFNAINFEELAYFGGSDVDKVKGGDNRDNLQGGGGDDDLEGRGGNDQIDGGAGSDVLDGGGGNDMILGGIGAYKDIISGGEGSDEIHGGDGDDAIHDGNDDDTSYGEDGHDTMFTGKGNDTIYGGKGNDTIIEADADDPANATNAPTRHIPNVYNDVIWGDEGKDTISAGTGTDWINGGDDGDTIDGGSGDDTILGGKGIDNIHGGEGYDKMSGGADKDFFNFSLDDFTKDENTGRHHSSDVIIDFRQDIDRLNFIGLTEHVTGGKFFLDDQNGTPGEAGEMMFSELNGNTLLEINLDNAGDMTLMIEFKGMAYDPNNPFSMGDVIF